MHNIATFRRYDGIIEIGGSIPLGSPNQQGLAGAPLSPLILGGLSTYFPPMFAGQQRTGLWSRPEWHESGQ
jgi:hypothetical protein